MYLVQFVFGLDDKIPVAEVGWTSYLPKDNPIFLGIGIGAVRSRSHMADSRYYFSMYTPMYLVLISIALYPIKEGQTWI